MEHLEVVVEQNQGTITTNFSELEKALRQEMSAYENFVVTEDEINIAKGDLAFLRKLRTSIDTRRKEIKKDFLTPYNEFETSCKQLMGIIDKPIELISQQLDLFEQDRIAHKRERIEKMYTEMVGEYWPFLPLEENYNEKWNNKSYSDNDIKFDISEKVTKVMNDINIIHGLHSEIEKEVLKTYKDSGNDLGAAISRNQQYIADKAKIAEKVKEEVKEEVKSEVRAAVREEVRQEVQMEMTDAYTATNEAPVKGQTITQSAPMEKLDDLIQMTKTVQFIVAAEDAEKVRGFFAFNNINYREV